MGAASELGDAELLRRSGTNRAPGLKWLTYTSTPASSQAPRWGRRLRHSLTCRLNGWTVPGHIRCVWQSARPWKSRSRHSRDGSGTGAPMVIRTVGPIDGDHAFASMRPSSRASRLHMKKVSPPWSALLFLAPALAANNSSALSGEGAPVRGTVGLSEGLKVANRRLSEANLSFATALVPTLEESDRLYRGSFPSSRHVFSRDIATALGLPLEEQERTYVAGLVHDIGKIGLPPSVLNKEGRSPSTSAARCNDIRRSASGSFRGRSIRDIALIVRHHHERIDGHGYPDGILGPTSP